MDPRVKVGVKAVALVTALAVAPQIAPFFAVSLGVEAFGSLLGEGSTLGDAIGGVGGSLGANALFAEGLQARHSVDAERNLHVSRALIAAAARELRAFGVLNPQVKAATDACAKELEEAGKDLDRLKGFFRESQAKMEDEAFWEEQVWPALQSGASLEGFLWADFARVIGERLAAVPNMHPSTVETALDVLRERVMGAMRRQVATVLLNDPHARHKLNYYFKTLVTRTLGEHTERLVDVQAKLDSVLTTVSVMAARQESGLIEAFAGTKPLDEDAIRALLAEQTQAIQDALNDRFGPGLDAFDLEVSEHLREERRFRPEAEWTPYQTTDALERTFERLLADPQPLKWLTLTGPGGAGKSRSARELARRLKRQGWRVALYAPRTQEALSDADRQTWQTHDLRAPTLIVVDYASERARAVGDMLKALAQRMPDGDGKPQPGCQPLGAPVVVLLIERVYSDQLEWVKAMLGQGGTWALKGQFEGGYIRLPGLDREKFLAVAKASCEKAPTPAHPSTQSTKSTESTPPSGAPPAPPPRHPWPGDEAVGAVVATMLGEPDSVGEDARPLYAQFLGEAIAANGLDGVRRWSPTDLARFTLRRELEKAQARATLTERNVNLVTLASLVGGLSDASLTALQAKAALVLPPRVPGDRAVRAAHKALVSFTDGSPRDDYPPLLPDLLAELLVLERLAGRACLDDDTLPADAKDPSWAIVDWAAMNRRDEASRFLAKAVQDFPAHPAATDLDARHPDLLFEGYFARGVQLYGAGDSKAACECWSACDPNHPHAHMAHYNWGNTLHAMAREAEGEERALLYREACEKYAQATRHKPDTHEAHSNWGITLDAMAREAEGEERARLFREACEKYAEATRHKPDDHEAHYNWGNTRAAMAREAEGEERARLYREACEKYAEATRHKPDDHQAYNNWGNTLAAMAREAEGEERARLYREACEKYAEATRHKPDDHQAYNNWGNTLAAMAREAEGEERARLFQEACEKYAEATRHKPDKHEAHSNWGNTLHAMAREAEGEERARLFREACEKYAQATRHKPDMHEAHYNWGNTLHAMAREAEGEERARLFREACEKYAEATRHKPDKHEAHYNWGITLHDMAREAEGAEQARLFGEACAKYAEALRHKPDDHEAHSNWGITLHAMAQEAEGAERARLFREACEKYAEATRHKPDMHEAHANWGITLILMANDATGPERCRLLREARAKVERAREGLDDHPAIVQILALIREAQAEDCPDDV